MAFVGGTLFEIGSYLMYVESLNTGHEELFGEELLGLVEGKSSARSSAGNMDSRDPEKHTGRSQGFRWI